MSSLTPHSRTHKSKTCTSAHIFSHMQCKLTLMTGIEMLIGSMYAFGQDHVSKRDPRSLSFPPLFRLSCGATYDPSAGRMQCLGTPTGLYTSIRQALGRKQGLMENQEKGA